ncbi:hypothetical protein LZL87_008828 [Fusarium oxysporum]|nr:hypothetical protein LZL87_008828 [Fusarium oxysporum]
MSDRAVIIVKEAPSRDEYEQRSGNLERNLDLARTNIDVLQQRIIKVEKKIDKVREKKEILDKDNGKFKRAIERSEREGASWDVVESGNRTLKKSQNTSSDKGRKLNELMNEREELTARKRDWKLGKKIFRRSVIGEWSKGKRSVSNIDRSIWGQFGCASGGSQEYLTQGHSRRGTGAATDDAAEVVNEDSPKIPEKDQPETEKGEAQRSNTEESDSDTDESESDESDDDEPEQKMVRRVEFKDNPLTRQLQEKEPCQKDSQEFKEEKVA